MDGEPIVVDSQLGYWWLPDDTEHQVAGSLLTLATGRHIARLTKMLPGATRQFSDAKEYPIVHGQLTSGQPLSLLRAIGVAEPGAPDWTQTLYPESTIEGGQMSSIDEPFLGALVGMPHLIEWLGSFVAQRSQATLPSESAQKRVTVNIPEIGEVIIAETEQTRVDARGRSESKDAAIIIHLEQPAPKSRIDELVRAVQDMVTFFSGVANPLARYELLRPTGEVPPVWRVLEWSEYSKPGLTAPTHHWSEMVLPAADEQFEQDRIVPRWLEIHREAESSLNQILAFTYVRAPFVDVHFLALVYGLEGLHRKFETPAHRASSRAHSEIERATAQLNSKTRKYLKHLLDLGDEPALEQRLLHIAGIAGRSVTPLLATFPNYASRIAGTRNVMAHQLKAKAPISPTELPDFVDLLRFLGEAYILRKLGWTEEQVQWIFIRRAGYGRFVSHRGGRLLPTQE